MYTKVMTVTPEEARLWLDTKNSNNRPISENAVLKYSQEMEIRQVEIKRAEYRIQYQRTACERAAPSARLCSLKYRI